MIFQTAADALKAAPVGHFVMFREKGHVSEWRVMSPDQRANSHAMDWNSWRTWCRKEVQD